MEKSIPNENNDSTWLRENRKKIHTQTPSAQNRSFHCRMVGLQMHKHFAYQKT